MTVSTDITVSVIICAYTEERWDELVEAVDSLQHQTSPPHEIILSIDHNVFLYERAQKYFTKEIKIFKNYGPKGLSGARNSGIAASTGTAIAFLDDDARAAPDWLEALCAHLQSTDVMGVGGAVEPLWEITKPAWFPEEFLWVVGCTYKGLPQKLTAIRNPMGGCMLWRRNIFKIVGGFRSGIGRIGKIPLGCEETELCIRARQEWPEKKFLFEPGSKINHHVTPARATLRYFLARCYGEGISKAYVSYLVGSHDGLSSERSYVIRILPIAVLRGLINFFQGDVYGFARSGAIIIGFLFTLFGYVAGKISNLLVIQSKADFEADL